MVVTLGRSLTLLEGFEPRLFGSPVQSLVEILTTLYRMQHITNPICIKTCLNGRRESLFPLAQVCNNTKGRQYLKKIKHNLSLQKATFKPLFSTGRGIVAPAPHQHSHGTSKYRQYKLNTNFSAPSLNNEKQERAHEYLIVSY
jgi:hypothetical protein